MTGRARGLLLGVALAVLTAGCGGGGEVETNAYSDAVAPRLLAETPVDDDARRCLAVALVEALGGPEALESSGVDPTELAAAEDVGSLGLRVETDEAVEIADSFHPCGISPVELLLAQLDLPDDRQTCVERNVDEAALRSFIVATIVEGRAAEDETLALVDPLLVCFPE